MIKNKENFNYFFEKYCFKRVDKDGSGGVFWVFFGGGTFQWALYIAAIHKMTPWVLKEFQKWSFMQILPILLVVFSFLLHIFVQYLLQCNDKKYASMVGGRGGGVVTNDTNVYCCPVHHTQAKPLRVLFFFLFFFRLRIHPRVCSSSKCFLL